MDRKIKKIVNFGKKNINQSSYIKKEVIIFGCPSSGAEELEVGTFAPMRDGLKDRLSGKKVALFGSYGWGGGKFMETWKDDCSSSSITVTRSSQLLHPSAFW
ncbi:MAG: hypothetical protein R3Y47_00260 [Lachnospiraceae bacterium]